MPHSDRMTHTDESPDDPDAAAPMDPALLFTAEFWDERYSSGETAWSGNPNPQLVERIAGRTPRPGSNRALEAGCGDGSDAIWLAGQGWQVTAVDVSRVATDRGAARAGEAGVLDRISWQQQDLTVWAPEEGAYDLVTAQFLHLPDLDAVHRRLAAGVRPGGTLLLVLHAHTEVHDGHAWGGVEMFRTPEQIVQTPGRGLGRHRRHPAPHHGARR